MSGAMTSRYGAQVVATIDPDWLAGLVPVLIQALRTGVAVQALDGVVAMRTASRLVAPMSDKRDRRKILSQQLLDERKAERRARRYALDTSKTDDAAEQWEKQADSKVPVILRLEKLIAELDAQQQPAIPAQFVSEVDYLLQAFQAIVVSGGFGDSEMADAIAAMLPDRSIRINADASLEACATVLLPMDGRVGRLGPLTWQVKQPQLTYGLLFVANEAAGLSVPRFDDGWRGTMPTTTYRPDWHDESVAALSMRTDVGNKLCAAGYTNNGIACVLDAPLPQIAQVLLARASAQPIPDWLADDWRDPIWGEHLEFAYRNATGVRWESPPWHRQAVIDTIAKLGGSATLRAVLDHLSDNGIGYYSLRAMSREQSSGKRKRNPLLRRLGRPFRRDKHLQPGDDQQIVVGSPICPRCGANDPTIIHAIEIVGDAVCRCGALVNTRRLPGPHNASVTVPADYHLLRVPPRVWTTLFHERGENRAGSKAKLHAARAAADEAYPQRPSGKQVMARRKRFQGQTSPGP